MGRWFRFSTTISGKENYNLAQESRQSSGRLNVAMVASYSKDKRNKTKEHRIF
jgi:hypothetical protein